MYHMSFIVPCSPMINKAFWPSLRLNLDNSVRLDYIFGFVKEVIWIHNSRSHLFSEMHLSLHPLLQFWRDETIISPTENPFQV